MRVEAEAARAAAEEAARVETEPAVVWFAPSIAKDVSSEEDSEMVRS